MFTRLSDSPGRSASPLQNSTARRARADPARNGSTSSSAKSASCVRKVRGTSACGKSVRRSAASAAVTASPNAWVAATSTTVRARPVTARPSISTTSAAAPRWCRTNRVFERPPAATSATACSFCGHTPARGRRHSAAADECEKTTGATANSLTAWDFIRCRSCRSSASHRARSMYAPRTIGTISPRFTRP